MVNQKNAAHPHAIIIAGAGASAPLGYSTLFDFESAIAKYAPNTTAKEKRELSYLFQQVRQCLVSKGEYTDFEAILWRFSNYLDLCNNIRLDQFLEKEFLSTIPNRFQHSAFVQKISQGRNIIDRVIVDHYGQPPQNLKAMKTIFEFLKIIIDVNRGVLDYFTTNYDIGLEGIWTNVSNNVRLKTGIKNPLKLLGEWDSRLLKIEDPNRKGLYVHRLHGCVRWFRHVLKKESESRHDCKIIANAIPPRDKNLEACVMYPGRKLHTSEHPFVDSFKRLHSALSLTTCCIILGTSFRDNNMIEYLLAANDRRESPLPIIVINNRNMQPRFFQRIKEVRKKTHFHYTRKDWQIMFVVGNYLDKSIQEEIISVIHNPSSINIHNERDATI
ncbi:MAG: hypothetical protein WC769_03850 [Thermodesulfovibrionales bacterium]|jgi:hypothetical protein